VSPPPPFVVPPVDMKDEVRSQFSGVYDLILRVHLCAFPRLTSGEIYSVPSLLWCYPGTHTPQAESSVIPVSACFPPLPLSREDTVPVFPTVRHFFGCPATHFAALTRKQHAVLLRHH